MRRLLKRFLPDHETLAANRWLAPFGSSLLHPRLWHLNRRSAAGAVAVGLACGLIPGPFQMLGAAGCCVLFKLNLPLAVLLTLYTNPLTIVPIYYGAFRLGHWILGPGPERFVEPPPFDAGGVAAWVGALGEWFAGIGQPLALGLVALAFVLASLGYVATLAAWRLQLVQRWRARRRRAR